jgi:hypothetical protein
MPDTLTAKIATLLGRDSSIIRRLRPDLWDGVGTPRRAAEALFAELKVRIGPLSGRRDPLGERAVVHLVCE